MPPALYNIRERVGSPDLLFEEGLLERFAAISSQGPAHPERHGVAEYRKERPGRYARDPRRSLDSAVTRRGLFVHVMAKLGDREHNAVKDNSYHNHLRLT